MPEPKVWNYRFEAQEHLLSAFTFTMGFEAQKPIWLLHGYQLQPEGLGVLTRPKPNYLWGSRPVAYLYFKFQSHGKVNLNNSPHLLCTHGLDLAQEYDERKPRVSWGKSNHYCSKSYVMRVNYRISYGVVIWIRSDWLLSGSLNLKILRVIFFSCDTNVDNGLTQCQIRLK